MSKVLESELDHDNFGTKIIYIFKKNPKYNNNNNNKQPKENFCMDYNLKFVS